VFFKKFRIPPEVKKALPWTPLSQPCKPPYSKDEIERLINTVKEYDQSGTKVKEFLKILSLQPKKSGSGGVKKGTN
jgi:hypothetical protein